MNSFLDLISPPLPPPPPSPPLKKNLKSTMPIMELPDKTDQET